MPPLALKVVLRIFSSFFLFVLCWFWGCCLPGCRVRNERRRTENHKRGETVWVYACGLVVFGVFSFVFFTVSIRAQHNTDNDREIARYCASMLLTATATFPAARWRAALASSTESPGKTLIKVLTAGGIDGCTGEVETGFTSETGSDSGRDGTDGWATSGPRGVRMVGGAGTSAVAGASAGTTGTGTSGGDTRRS